MSAAIMSAYEWNDFDWKAMERRSGNSKDASTKPQHVAQKRTP